MSGLADGAERYDWYAEHEWLSGHRPPPAADPVVCHGNLSPSQIRMDPTDVDHPVVTSWTGPTVDDRERDVAKTALALWSTPYVTPRRADRMMLKLFRDTLVEQYQTAYAAAAGVELDPARLAYWRAVHILDWSVGVGRRLEATERDPWDPAFLLPSPRRSARTCAPTSGSRPGPPTDDPSTPNPSDPNEETSDMKKKQLIWPALTLGLTGNGLRLRKRVKQLDVLSPTSAVFADHHRLITGAGVRVNQATARAASAYALDHELDALDLVPGDLSTERLLDLVRLVDPATYRDNPLAIGRGAGHALLVTTELAERAGIERFIDVSPPEFVEVMTRIKRHAARSTGLVLAPGCRR